MPFCKFHLFRKIFWQDALVEEGAVAAVAIGRVRPQGGHRDNSWAPLSKPLSQKSQGNVYDQSLSSKGEQKKCSLGSRKHVQISVSSPSFPVRLPAQVSPPPPPSLDVILCRWSQTHLFWLWDGKKQTHPSLSGILVLSPTCCPGKIFAYCQLADSSFAF